MTTRQVGEGLAYETIQAAIDAAEAGDTIMIAAGTYDGFTVDVEGLTIVGSGAVVIEGSLLTDLGVPEGTALNDFFEANHPAYSASTGVTIAADGVSLSGLTLTGFAVALDLGTSDGVSISGSTFVDNITGIRKGTEAAVTNLTVSGNTFTQGIHGMTVYAADNGNGAFDGITMDGNSFSKMSEKGVYFEQLSNAAFSDNSFDDVGNYGRVAPPFGPAGQDGEFGQAIDINLKYEVYENVVFTDTTITNSGHSDQDGAGDTGTFAAAIGVKIRDDAPSYSATPASFTGSITFDGLSIDGTSTGIRIGEPGKDNGGPNVTLTDVTIANASVGDLDNTTDAADGGIATVTLGATEADFDASASQAGVDVTGNALANTITGGAGDDTITGGGGADALDGGAGTDTATYAGTLATASITDDGEGNFVVTTGGAEGTDTLTGVEIVDHGGTSNILLVGNGGFATIQAAIDAASAGDTIMIAAGTYDGFTVDVEGLTIVGSGAVVIEGSLLTDLGVPEGTALNDFFEANHPAYSASTGVTIAADGVSLSGLTFTGFAVALDLGTSDGVSISGSTFVDNITGIRKGTEAAVTNLTVSGNTFTQGIHGMTVYAADNGNGAFDGITMDGNSFSKMSEKGVYFEQLSNAAFSDNSFDDVGNYGRVAPPFGPAGQDGEFGQAIDINLKYEVYENVVFTDTTITNSGHSDQDGAGDIGTFAAAIGVKIRDDAPSYSATPASFTGSITFDGLSIDGTSTGIRIGEPGKDNGGPNVTLTDVTIANASVGDLDNTTDAADGGIATVTLGATEADFDASASQAGVDVTGNALANTITGGAGDDTITGGGGADALDGGAGTDTATYAGTLATASITDDGEGNFVVTTGGAEGTDTLTGVEIVDHGGASNILLVGNGGFATIQAAIDAASAGDTIMIAAGTYAESLVIGKGVTLLGLGEVVIDPATGNAITIDGDVDGADIVLDNLVISGGEEGIYVDTDANAGKLTVRNSTISGNSDHGIFVLGDDPDNDGSGGPITAGITAIDVIDTAFANNGFFTGLNGSGHIKLFGFTGDALFQNVTIAGAGEATPLADQPDNAIEITGYVNNGNANPVGTGAPDIGAVVFDGVTITGAFHKNPVAVFHFTAIDGLAIGGDNGGLDLSGATSNWGPLLNLDGIEDAVIDASGFAITFPGGASIVTEIQGDKPGQTPSDQTITGTSADDRLIGKEGDDTLNGGDGDDELYGHDKPGGSALADDGADILNGGAGSDALYGGDGDDTLDGGTGTDALDGGAGTDTATYAGTLATASITDDGEGNFVVTTGGAEGTDTLTGVEIVDHGGASNILLVGNGGFATIQAAIDAASAGDTIMIAAGTYAESLVIGKGVTLLGLGEVVIDPATGNAITIDGDVDGADIVLDNLVISGGEEGIYVDTDANAGKLTVRNSTISGNSDHGIFVLGDDPDNDGSGGPITAGITAIDVIDTAFANNGFFTGLNGSGHIKLFGFTGDALFQNVTIAGAGEATPLADQPDNAIEITGYVNNGNANPVGTGAPDIGAVVFDGVTITGAFHKNPVAVFHFTAIDGLAIGGDNGGLDLSGATSNWGPLLNLDGIEDAVIDASGFAITFPGGASIVTEIQGDKPGQTPSDQTITGTSADDRLIGKEGDDTLNGGDGDDELYGHDKPGGSALADDGADILNGGAGSDALYGGDGDDTLDGGTGTDALDGGAGTDTATYAGTLATASITDDGEGNFVVTTGGAEGTDTLTGVEIVDHGGASNILLVGNGGFATIQAAIDAASAGDTIMIAAGTYAESLVIGKGVTLLGLGEVVIDPATGNAITIDGDVDGADIVLDNLVISGGEEGIYVDTDANAGKLTVRNSTISGNSDHGIFVLGDDPDNDGSGGPITAGITAIDVIDTAFANNGFFTGLNGSGHIKLFGFTGDALFQNVTIAGAGEATPLADQPDNAIEITGYVNNGNANPVGTGAPDIGAVVFDGVTITGAFHKNPVAVFHFTAIDGLAIGGDNGGLDLSGATSNWGPLLNLDGIEDAVIDASGFAITFPGGASIVTEIQGDKPGQTPSDQTITGTSADDRLIGKEGDDTLNGGDGDDELYGHDKPGGYALADDGADILNGGAGSDALYGGDGDDTLDGGTGTDALDGGAGTDTADFGDETGAVVVTLDGGTAAGVTVGGTGRGTLANVENVIAGSGDDVLTGDANANVFTGGAGSDTIDGGGGNDTVVYAGTLTSASLTALADANPGLGGDQPGWQVAGAAEGTDTLLNVKFVEHAGGRLLLVGNGGFADINAAVMEATKTGDTIVFAAPPAPEDPIVITVTPTAPLDLTIPYDNPTEITVTSDFDNTIQTGGGDDVIIIVGDGDNIIKTGDGNDYVQASVGNDQIIGGSGNGDDVYDGGGGGNTMIYTSATNSITVDLNLLDRSTTPASEGGTVGDLLEAALGAGNANTPVGLAEGIDIGTDALINVANIVSGSGSDTLIGNGDANTIEGRAGDDTITGNGGEDILTGGLGSDDVDGGDGDDTLAYVAGDGTDTMLDGGADADTLAITGRTGDDAALADTIKVGVASGVIVKLTSNDATHGIANNVAAIETVTLDLATGHSGNDTLDYSITTSGNAITVNLGTGAATGFAGTIAGVDNVTGGAGGDTLTGDGTANVLAGNAGDDTITGGGGADVLTGGTGVDSVYGGDGNDTIHYTIGDGVDAAVDGGGDTDTLVVKGTASTETIDAVFNGTLLTSLEGAGLTSIESVTLDALGGTDTLSYAGSTGAVTVNLGTGAASGFTSIAGVERVTGGNLGDTLTGDGLGNTLEGADGADVLDGGAGDDTLVGGTGADTLTGGTGTDTANYAAVLSTSAATFDGTDWQLDGGAEGTDTLAGIERISHGGVGQFLLVGGGAYASRSAAEAVMGANDVLVFAATTSAVSDTDGTANVVSEDVGNGTAVGIDASATTGTGGGSVTYALADDAGGRFAINATTGVVTVANGALIDYEAATSHTIVVRASNSLGAFTDQAFVIDVEDVTASLITGTKGNDTLIGTGEPDAIDGGKGNDKLTGGGGDDVLTGGKGKDQIDGGDGIDTASYAASKKAVQIDLGKSKQKGGDAKGDKLVSIENVVGSNKNDKLTGDNGDNVLDGAGGKDQLNGKGGADLLIGGAGKDTFYFKKGYDLDAIADFSNGDKIDIAMKGVKSFKALKELMADVDGDVVIDFGKGDVLTIQDTSVDSLGRGDFQL